MAFDQCLSSPFFIVSNFAKQFYKDNRHEI